MRVVSWCFAAVFSVLSSTAHAGQAAFLRPDQAFNATVSASGPAVARVHFHIAPGYYLYRDRIHLSAVLPATLGPYQLPKGETHDIPFYGPTVVFPHSFDVVLPIAHAPATGAVLQVAFQGCAVNGICYPPRTLTLPVTITHAHSLGSLPGGRLWWRLLAAFGAGLLLTFTPCVLPMIPILSGVIVGGGGLTSRRRAVVLSVAYVLGTATTYGLIGAAAGATGAQLQAYFQNAWAIGLLAALFVALALSLFGLYELEMPAAIQSRLVSRGNALGGSSVAAVYLLGVFSALIIGACVSPLVISVISVAIAAHSALEGATLMVAMALGLGTVLVVLGFGAGALLPRAGAWMDEVKRFFGFLLLGLAIYLLSGLPGVPTLYLWALLLITAGVSNRALEPLAPNGRGARIAQKGVALFVLLWGVFALAGALRGGRDPLAPLARAPHEASVTATPAGTSPQASTAQTAGPSFVHVSSLAALNAVEAQATAQHRPLFIDFYAAWCTDCVLFERETLADPRVEAALAPFVRVQADVTDQNPDTDALKRHFGVYGPPALLFFGANGREDTALRRYGLVHPGDFLSLLHQVSR